MTLTVPINFGHRQCDRLLVRALATNPGRERETVLWMMFLCWQDYATAREDRRNVPLDASLRAVSPSIVILEEFIGWKAEAGGFVAAAIEAGFFLLTPVTDDEAELILTDFFPANAVASNLTNSERGGVSKAFNTGMARAEVAAADQLKLFKAQPGPLLPDASEREIKAAILFVHSISQALRRHPPADDVWKQTILARPHRRDEVVREEPPEPENRATLGFRAGSVPHVRAGGGAGVWEIAE
jgi:hypothetical protein